MGALLGKVYHSPQDDLSQKIDWDAGARYAVLNYRISRGPWPTRRSGRCGSQGDYFGDLFDPAAPRAPRRPRATLTCAALPP